MIYETNADKKVFTNNISRGDTHNSQLCSQQVFPLKMSFSRRAAFLFPKQLFVALSVALLPHSANFHLCAVLQWRSTFIFRQQRFSNQKNQVNTQLPPHPTEDFIRPASGTLEIRLHINPFSFQRSPESTAIATAEAVGNSQAHSSHHLAPVPHYGTKRGTDDRPAECERSTSFTSCLMGGRLMLWPRPRRGYLEAYSRRRMGRNRKFCT